jgi:prepilin-type N-terminal cleavage/methylation domain-containing protein
MKKRSGFTLVELLVVISMMAVILPMAGGTVFFLLRAQSQSAEALRDAMAMTQLSHTFRSDVHAAHGARLVSGTAAGDGIVLELDDSRTAEYQPEANGCVSRTVRRGETRERREQFRIGSARPKFQLANDGREVALIIAPRTRGAVLGDGAGVTAGIRIAAVVGRNAKVGEFPAYDAVPLKAGAAQNAPAKTGSASKVGKTP